MLKFLAFEQVFKNSLTTLPMGGGKGGSDFDPKGKSDNEVMRFCQSFMTELYRHIGPDTDVPAGDIGVGGREIGFLFGQYKRIVNRFCGVLTGKGFEYGGSLLRPEATGYGCVYFAQEMLATRERQRGGQDGARVRVRQRGPVHRREAQRTGRQAHHAVRLRRHDRGPGRDQPREAGVGHAAEERPPRADSRICRALQGRHVSAEEASVGRARPTGVPQRHAERDRCGGRTQRWSRTAASWSPKGANMPTVPEGVDVFHEAKMLYGPGKAANAGGVATSGLEMTQNAGMTHWTREEVDQRSAADHACHPCQLRAVRWRRRGHNYVRGANVGGFVKVADAMLAQGVV